MKNGIITEINWELVGAQLANADDEDQAKMLNAMAREMLSWGTKYQAEMQVTSIQSKMTDEAKELLNFNFSD
jgi:hypothetical protein